MDITVTGGAKVIPLHPPISWVAFWGIFQWIENANRLHFLDGWLFEDAGVRYIGPG